MPYMLRRTGLMLVLSGLVAAFSLPATAQSYPERAIEMIVPFPAGGSTDLTARALADAAEEFLSQPISVLNRGGASGTIGVAELVSSKPDGYRIGIATTSILTVQPHRNTLPFNSPNDYETVLSTVSIGFALTIQSGTKWKTLEDFIAYARANPGKIRIGTPGIGTPAHLNLEAFAKAAGIELTHVPFAGGSEAIPALLGGHVEGLVASLQELPGHLKSGKLTVLVSFTDARDPIAPNAPTAVESGYDVALGSYTTIIVPKGTPNEVVTTLHDAFKKGLETKAFQKFKTELGFGDAYMNPEELKKRLVTDYEFYGKLLAELGLSKK